MKKNYSLVFIFFLCFGLSGYGQVTTIDFETAGDGYTPSGIVGSGNTDAFNRTNSAVNGNNTYHWVAEDLSLTNPSISLDQIDITGSTSFTFAVDFSYPNNAQWDSTDELIITYSIDGGVYQNLMAVQHINTDAFNNPAALDLDFDGNGDSGQELSDSTFTTFTTSAITISGNSTLDIQFQFNQLTGGGEGIYIDNITITETGSAGPNITATPTAINNLDYAFGNGPSTAQSFDVEGTLLVGDITLTAPTNFELSLTSGSGFANSITIPLINANGTNTIYTRLVNGLAINGYSGNITLASSGATNETVSLAGNVTFSGANCSDLFMSEYIEGSSNNKFIEIYNPTNSMVALGNYDLQIYVNGSNSASVTIPLSGSITSFDVYVIENSSETLGFSSDLASGSLTFNGDDVVVLRNNGTIIDVIGQIGLDPGSEWNGISCTQGTANGTLVRNSTVQIGDSDGSNAFDPDSEWTCYNTDDISNLGSHTNDCQAPSTELQLVDNTSTNQNCGYTIDYGSVGIGSISDLTFDIENIGSIDLTVSSFGITGDYTIVSPATPLTITSGNSQTVTLRFTPVSDGTSTGALTINNDDIDEGTCIVNLTGVGFTPGPNINVRGVIGSIPTIANGSITTSSLNNTYFAQQTINTTSQTKTFRIGNEGGTANLNVSSITLSGNTADFFVTSSFTNPFAIDTFQDFTITFQPTTLSGLRSVTVSIANTDSTKDPYTFVVEGIANCAAVSGSISPTEGPAGTTVTIVSPGNDLTGATADLNGVTLTPVSDSTLELVVRLPNTILSGGPLSIELSNGCVFSSTFTLIDNTIAGCQTTSSAVVSDLFISEITDSPSGSLTYIELYNATGSLINFATTNYSIRIYNNGSTSTFNDLILDSGTVASGSTYVISCGTNDAQCPVTGGDGSLAQVNLATIGASINFFRSGNQNIGHDYIGLYSTAAISVSNPTGNIDSWGSFGDQTWATGLGLGDKGANFQRDTNATFPNTTFSTADWIITDWTDADCSDVDYSTIGAYDFSTGVPPTITLQPIAPAFECTFSASLTISGTEGYDGPTPADTQNLAYQWYFNQPGTSTWTEISPANPNYTGQQTATLNIIDTFNLDSYQYYCQLREDSDTCFKASNAVKLDVRVSTWNGTWSVPPSLDRFAILNANYNTGNGTNGQDSFGACGLVVNSGTLTVANSNFVEVTNDVTVETGAEILVETQGAFVQRGVGAAAGTFTLNGTATSQVNKLTAPLANWYDYTYWSSPVATADVDVALGFANQYRRFWYDANLYLDTDNNDIDDDDNDWTLATGSGQMVVGRGYAATHNNIGFVAGNQYLYNFEGALNTGDYFYPLVIQQ